MTDKTNRIQWIDLAKGFCIILVVLQHVSELTHVDYPLSLQAFGFRMPLYFILSGLFFKQYEGFFGFLKRKTNKLLIPFLFFYFFTSFLLYCILLYPDQLHVACYNFKKFYYDDYIMFNNPIWFLLCLFEVNLLFYFIQWLAQKLSEKHKTPIVLLLSLVIGFTGLTLGVKEINIPFFIDTAMSSLPLFAFGWWLFRHSNILTSPIHYLRGLIVIITCFIVLYYTAVPVKWGVNRISLNGIGFVYISGIAGTIMVLMLAKIIGCLPVISYWGRYSIIILCTHCLLATLITTYFSPYLSGVSYLLIVFTVTMLVCSFLIPLMRRYMPHVTAQKDLIRI